MTKLILTLVFFLSFPLLAQKVHSGSPRKVIVTKVKISNYKEFKQALVQKQLIGKKWMDYVLRLNGLTLQKIHNLKNPIVILFPKKKLVVHKRYTYSLQSSLGHVDLKAEDELNSNLTLVFLKIGLGIQRRMTGYSLRFGLAMNNYLSIKYKSDFGSTSSNKINDYYDFSFGGTKSFGGHKLTLQYDNLNFLLINESNTEVDLKPTRLDRFSIFDSYQIGNNYFLTGSLGYFPTITSSATGYDYSLGAGKRFNQNFSLSAGVAQNHVTKNSIKNQSTALMITGTYQF